MVWWLWVLIGSIRDEDITVHFHLVKLGFFETIWHSILLEPLLAQNSPQNLNSCFYGLIFIVQKVDLWCINIQKVTIMTFFL